MQEKSRVRVMEPSKGDALARGDEQSTMRIRREIQEKLKLIAALESLQGTEQITLFSLTDRIMSEYIRKYESILGRPLASLMKSGELPPK
jgi:hypothetical protein